MSLLFADTFYFIALLDSADPHHARAVAWSRLRDTLYVTTEFVLVELADAFHSPGRRQEFVVFQDALRSDARWRILPAHRRLYAAGLDLYRRRDKRWQLTDCISFAVMHRLRVNDALTGDRHFIQAGFKALLAQTTG